MPILFGWGKTTVRDHGECIAATCPRCHNQVLLRHLQITTWFTLFFIPVIPYKRRRALVCGICRWLHDVPKDAVALTEEMTTITADWRAGRLDDAAYSQRVDAFWSFQGADGAADPPSAAPSGSADHPAGGRATPPPPAPPGDAASGGTDPNA